MEGEEYLVMQVRPAVRVAYEISVRMPQILSDVEPLQMGQQLEQAPPVPAMLK